MYDIENDVSLEQEKVALVKAFQSDSPDLYDLYRSVFDAMSLVQPVIVEVSYSGDSTSGQPKRNY